MPSVKSPAFQWYSKDILSSARVAMMTLEEEGAYRRALDFCWLNGSLPNDPGKLARVIGKGCSIEVATVVQQMFIVDKKNPQQIVHERLESERKKQKEFRQSKSKAGTASGLSRRRKNNLMPEQVLNSVDVSFEQNANATSTKTNSSSPSSSSSSGTTTTTAGAQADEDIPDISNHWAVKLLEEKLGVTPTIPAQELIAANVEDEVIWRQVLEIWRVNNHAAYKVWNIVDRYKRELVKSKAPPKSKTARLRTVQSSDEWRGYYAKELSELIKYVEDAEILKKVELLLSDLPKLDYERFCQRRGELEDLGLEIG
jgi:uncharacterized protein YdaU (DUF1376 family)